MRVELTDAEILCLHKWMWTDMQNEFGNNPYPDERIDYKYRWCEEHDIHIWNNCFLCEHAGEDVYSLPNCPQCLVLWPDDMCCYDQVNGSRDEYKANSYYLNAPISDILNLPTREFDPDRRTKIWMRECDIEELKRRMKEGDI
jgi:hypothetical protein